MKKIFIPVLIFVFVWFWGCQKEKELTPDEILEQKENDIIDKMDDVMPSSVMNRYDNLFDDLKNQDGYEGFLDSIDNAYDDLISTIEDQYSIDEFKEAMDHVIDNQNILKSNNNDYFGPGYAKAVEINPELSGSLGVLIYGGIHGGVGGGAKIIYDFVNMDRQIYYYTFCNYGYSIGIGFAAALSAGVGFTGINEMFTGIPYLPENYCEGKFEGFSITKGYSIDLNAELILGINASIGVGSTYEAIGDFGKFGEWVPCPINKIKIENSIKSYSFMVGGSVSATLGGEIAAAFSSDKIGANYHSIESSYDSYSNKRTLRGLRMAKELILEEPLKGIYTGPSVFDLTASALAIYYSFKDENDFPARKPSIATREVDEITSSSAKCGGYIKYNGGADISEMGLIWGEGKDIELDNIAGQTTVSDHEDGFYDGDITQLIPDTDYWVVAYAINSAEKIGYGEEVKFSTLDHNNPPIAALTSSSESGTTETNFVFNAAGSMDTEDPFPLLLFRWDFDNDGVWEMQYSEASIVIHQFTSPGTYTVCVMVKDTDEAEHKVCIEIVVTSSTGGKKPDGYFTDSRDSEEYGYVNIGSQTWMTENLAYLPSVSSSSSGSSSNPYYYVYDYQGSSTSQAKNTNNYKSYGALYNWEAAKISCPEGWQLPSRSDWQDLKEFLGNGASTSMKSVSGWQGNGNGDNNSGFNAFPAGDRRPNEEDFNTLGKYAYFWSSSSTGEATATNIHLGAYESFVSIVQNDVRYGFSVRCIQKSNQSFTDSRDGNTYDVVNIGTQTWMAENLAYLPSVSPKNKYSNNEAQYYVYGYDGSSVNSAKGTNNYKSYGTLYNWEAADNSCPDGWHLPSDNEWKTLEKNLGMSSSDADEGGFRESGEVGFKLKSISGWNSGANGNNSSGFNGFPGGRNFNGDFGNLGEYGHFWTSTKDGSDHAWRRALYYGSDGVARNGQHEISYGLSVRCIKD